MQRYNTVSPFSLNNDNSNNNAIANKSINSNNKNAIGYSINNPVFLLQHQREVHNDGFALLHHHRYRYPIINNAADLVTLYLHTVDDATTLLSPHDPIRAALMLNAINCVVHNGNDRDKGLSML
uniref:Uncharacterized protein n=1 Tax=Lygus hesperus TaxID=30085 RepID=A0A0A9YG96_LYGHE